MPGERFIRYCYVQMYRIIILQVCIALIYNRATVVSELYISSLIIIQIAAASNQTADNK